MWRWARGSASGVTHQLVMPQVAVWGPPIGGLKKAHVRLRREGTGGDISDLRPVDPPLVVYHEGTMGPRTISKCEREIGARAGLGCSISSWAAVAYWAL